jgi:hypothetical protein
MGNSLTKCLAGCICFSAGTFLFISLLVLGNDKDVAFYFLVLSVSLGVMGWKIWPQILPSVTKEESNI